jgi:hypothetical protein
MSSVTTGDSRYSNYGPDLMLSHSLPPLLEPESQVFTRLNKEVMLALGFGIISSSAFTHKNHRQVKHFFHSKIKMGRLWWLGQINVVIFGTSFSYFLHKQLRHPDIFANFPEGYYRKIHVEKMSRDIKTKQKYFSTHLPELQKRYAAIGITKTIDELSGKSTKNNILKRLDQAPDGKPWRTWEDIRELNKPNVKK